MTSGVSLPTSRPLINVHSTCQSTADTAKEKPQQARVIAVGSGRVNDDGKTFPLDVKAGDHVLIGTYSGTEIKLDGEEYLIVRDDEIPGVAEGLPELATV